MKLSKTILFGLTGAALMSSLALAHPHSENEDTVKKEEKVKIYKFKGDDGEVKSRLKINDFESNGVDLDTMLEGLESLEGLEGLEGLEALEGLKSLESIKGLSGLSKLSELGKLSELAELGEFNVETFDMDDGGTKIIIKRGKDGVLGEHELFIDGDKMHEKHAELMETHKGLMKKRLGSNDDTSRSVIKRLLEKHSGEQDVEVWADKGDDHHADIFESESDTRIVLDKDGDVQVLNDNGDTDINVQKEITIENGKRKTRIVIEMETDEN